MQTTQKAKSFGAGVPKERAKAGESKKNDLLSIRISESEKQALQQHFNEQGLSLPMGLRKTIRETIKGCNRA
jgi:hypothetical protein